jgi:hypothetical protein
MLMTFSAHPTLAASNEVPWVFMVGGALSLLILGRFLWLGYHSQNWPTTTGRIATCKIIRRRGNRGEPAGTVRLTLAYEVAGKSYVGGRIGYHGAEGGTLAEAESLARLFAEGTEVTVYYDPKNPRRAVLQPGTNPMLPMAMLIGAGFLAFGIALLFRE